ncbi:hypothetical protein Psuf_037680 [Phytohabitans suffuscus]|uniref:AMP-dependent synthetase/ligase domain-containing protein n=1 Tax=Phytohabitans suffuscus TaxID=624315 RepID=A0A6F8YK04_9ACTN|nr:hypothetical protein Psuf_037680 [Phytohabitans suffuscus]
MMDAPLLVSRILEHGSTVHGGADVRTWTGAGSSRMTYAEVGAKAAQLAHALRDDLGVTGDQRVATFMWNNAEHLVAYLGVPSMGPCCTRSTCGCFRTRSPTSPTTPKTTPSSSTAH